MYINQLAAITFPVDLAVFYYENFFTLFDENYLS